jgi:excisionase family DNA binding protein
MSVIIDPYQRINQDVFQEINTNHVGGKDSMASVANHRLLTVEEFAERIGKRPQTIRQKMWRREIDFLRIGRSIRFTEEMVEKALQAAFVPAIER